MKKLLTFVAIAALVLTGASFAYAANPEAVTITITLNHTKSLEVGGSANLTVNPGETEVGGAITVKNDGTGIEETVTLSGVTALPAGWALKFLFTDTDTAPASDDTAGWQDAAGISETIPYDVTKYLWIRLGAPNPTDLTTLDISVTINAG